MSPFEGDPLLVLTWILSLQVGLYVEISFLTLHPRRFLNPCPLKSSNLCSRDGGDRHLSFISSAKLYNQFYFSLLGVLSAPGKVYMLNRFVVFCNWICNWIVSLFFKKKSVHSIHKSQELGCFKCCVLSVSKLYQ